VADQQLSSTVLLEAASAPDFALLDAVAAISEEAVPLPDEPGLITQGLPEGTVIVLALICKALPKSPDPDPACVWP